MNSNHYSHNTNPMLPTHKPQRPIQQPLIFAGMGAFALAGWHRYYRMKNDVAKCLQIENEIKQLSIFDRKLISKLSYYIALENID